VQLKPHSLTFFFECYSLQVEICRVPSTPVPKKMRIEMIIGIQYETLDGHHRFLFITPVAGSIFGHFPRLIFLTVSVS